MPSRSTAAPFRQTDPAIDRQAFKQVAKMDAWTDGQTTRP
jgi:hypothetical protein